MRLPARAATTGAVLLSAAALTAGAAAPASAASAHGAKASHAAAKHTAKGHGHPLRADKAAKRLAGAQRSAVRQLAGLDRHLTHLSAAVASSTRLSDGDKATLAELAADDRAALAGFASAAASAATVADARDAVFSGLRTSAGFGLQVDAVARNARNNARIVALTSDADRLAGVADALDDGAGNVDAARASLVSLAGRVETAQTAFASAVAGALVLPVTPSVTELRATATALRAARSAASQALELAGDDLEAADAALTALGTPAAA